MPIHMIGYGNCHEMPQYPESEEGKRNYEKEVQEMFKVTVKSNEDPTKRRDVFVELVPNPSRKKKREEMKLPREDMWHCFKLCPNERKWKVKKMRRETSYQVEDLQKRMSSMTVEEKDNPKDGQSFPSTAPKFSECAKW